jgi:hypothetical protein
MTSEIDMQFRVLIFALAGFALISGGRSSAAPLVYGTYYDETVQFGCGSPNCQLTFSQTPTDKLLMVRKINCYAYGAGAPAVAWLAIATTFGGGQIQRTLPLPISSVTLGGASYASVAADIHWLVGQGRFPFITFILPAVASPNSSMSCTIVGDLLDPIQ